jgi:uncharacterized Ntn-hydrolase superfamily protein
MIPGGYASREMPASTFSIAAYDARSGEWGVAVQSKFLAIGALTPWARADVGAVATQAWINVSYGERGLSLLEEGLSAHQVVDRLTSEDPGRENRQLGVVDREGNAACFTGSGCFEWAGHRRGDGFSAQGNTLVSGDTLTALAERYEHGDSEPLARRLVEALAAAQDAGGDRRGQQAAAVVVVARGAGYGGADVRVDLRVDDHARPIDELRRLLDLHELYFGETPSERWLAVDDDLAAELREHLARLGYDGGDLEANLDAWAGVENFEERLQGTERIDPVLLAQLRAASEKAEAGGADDAQAS